MEVTTAAHRFCHPTFKYVLSYVTNANIISISNRLSHEPSPICSIQSYHEPSPSSANAHVPTTSWKRRTTAGISDEEPTNEWKTTTNGKSNAAYLANAYSCDERSHTPKAPTV